MTTSVTRPLAAGPKPTGYFCHLRMDDKHIGAVLVTDRVGVPLEFKYTEPVTTTKLHRILYGPTLERYLHETVIRERLAREVQSDVQYFITSYEDKEYLGQLSGKEMMAIQRANLAPGDTFGSMTRVREREAIVELEDGPTVRIAFSTSDEALQHVMVTWLQELGRTMDVVEPLERMTNALMSLCGEAKRV
jgi:hypothetical protein